MEDALIKVAAFVLCIAAGYIAGRSGKLGSRPGVTVSKLVLNFTLPCAVIHAFGSADFATSLLLLVPIGFACSFIPYLITLLITYKRPREERVFFLTGTSSFNIGCFALPFIQTVFPASLTVTACLFDAGNAVMATAGSYALTALAASEKPVEHPARFVSKRLIKSAAFDCYVVIVMLAIAGISIPDPIVTLTEPIASANACLAMLMLGLMLSLKVDAERLKLVAQDIGLRIVFSIILTVLIWAFLPFDYISKTIITIMLWAPASAVSTTFALSLGGDGGLASLANAITIVIGVIAIVVILLCTGVLS